MARQINPPNAPKPGSRYSQGVVHNLRGRRVVASGQIGVTPDGTIVAGFEGQVRQAFANLAAVLADAGMGLGDVVKLTVYVTEPGRVGLWRGLRDEALQGHLTASTYLQVAGLADPAFLVEIEAEAVREDV